MVVRYLGHSCFQWVLDNGMVLVADPYTKVGYEMPANLSADIVTLSHEHFDHNYVAGVNGIQTIIRNAGECEIANVRIQGIETYHDEKGGTLRGRNTVYKLYMEGISFCHFGDLGEPCSDTLLDKIGQIDVLMIPVGGTYTIDASEALKYVQRLSPKVVIPMHFRPKDGTLDIQCVDAFLGLINTENVIYVDGECKITQGTMKEYEGKILVFERAKRA